MKRILSIFAAIAALFSCAREKKSICDGERFPISGISCFDFDIVASQAMKSAKTAWVEGDKVNVWFDDHYSQDTPDLVLSYQSGKWAVVSVRQGGTVASSGTLGALYESGNDLSAMSVSVSETGTSYSAPSAKLSSAFKRNPMIITTESIGYAYDSASGRLSAKLDGWKYHTCFKVRIVRNADMTKSAERYALKLSRSKAFPFETFGPARNGSESTITFVSNYTGKTWYAGGVEEEDGLCFYYSGFSLDASSITFSLREYGGAEKICTKADKTISADNPLACVGVVLKYSDFSKVVEGDVSMEQVTEGGSYDAEIIDSRGINTQTDWDAFMGGRTDGFVVNGEIVLNCNVTANASIPSLTIPFNGRGHSITMDIPAEKSLDGLFGSLGANVRNVTLSGRIEASDHSGAKTCATLANVCGDNVTLSSVNCTADIVLDCQSNIVSSCSIAEFVASGSPTRTSCSFSGRLIAVNCESGQNPSVFPASAITDIPTGCFSLRQLKMTKDNIGNSYILQTEGGKVIVMDGGAPEEADRFCTVISETYGNHIDEWWFSHPHGDHVGVFLELMNRDASKRPTVDRIYHSKVPANIVAAEGGSNAQFLAALAKYKAEGGTVVDLRTKKERHYVDGITINVLDIATGDFPQTGEHHSPLNNASVILRVWDRKKSVIFLGDAGELKGGLVLKECAPFLHCDYLQMGHHGNWTCGKAFYDAVDFKAALWPSPSWVYNCSPTNPSGYDCWQYRQWVAAKGVTENHASCEGDWFLAE